MANITASELLEGKKIWQQIKSQGILEKIALNTKSGKLNAYDALTNYKTSVADLVDKASNFMCAVEKMQAKTKFIQFLKTTQNITLIVPTNRAIRSMPENAAFSPDDYALTSKLAKTKSGTHAYEQFQTFSGQLIVIAVEKTIMYTQNATLGQAGIATQQLNIVAQYSAENGAIIYLVDDYIRHFAKKPASNPYGQLPLGPAEKTPYEAAPGYAPLPGVNQAPTVGIYVAGPAPPE